MNGATLSRAELLRLRRAGLLSQPAESVRPPRDVLEEDLRALVAELNDEADPLNRAILFGRVQSVRRLLGIGGNTTTPTTQ